MTQAVADLNGEYQAHIQEIEAANPHDRQEVTSNDGILSVNWEDVLAVFSAKVTGAEDGSQVASLDDAQVDELRSIMWEMNAISYTTRTESSSVEVTSTDENGNEVTSTETVTETILEITITHKTPEEMAQQYNFNDRQNEYLALMTEPENENLWAELLGGYVSGGGQIIDPNTNWEGTGIFQWPLPQSYTITSWFGYRADPFTGEIDYHSGTDIGAPGGTPILAAADGTVTIANGIDSWGGGYGYYIKVRHNDTYETLYAHCRHLRNPVCPLFLHLCGGRPGGQAGRGDRLCRHHRELYRKPSPLRGVAKRAAHRRSQLLQGQRVKGSSSLVQAAAPHFFLSKLYPTSRMHRR